MLNLNALKNISHIRKYPVGSAVARSGSAELIVVLKGEAAVFITSLPSGTPDATIGPGSIFGEKALFLGELQPATVVALTDVFSLTLDRSSIVSFFQEEPEMAFELMKLLCEVRNPDSVASPQPSATDPMPPLQPEIVFPPIPEPKPSAPAVTAAPAPMPEQSRPSSLFPEGHGSYLLNLDNGNSTHLMDKSFACPACKKDFRTKKVKASKLVAESTDRDMRNRYKGIEPLYYDVATCPHCLYSALMDQFANPDFVRPDFRRELQAFQPEVAIKTGEQIDTFSVFAGYYLALFCAPKCFASHHLAQAKLLLKLSRIYQDCGDSAMEISTAKRALEEYLYIYLNENNGPEQDQQLCAILGELYLKQGDMRNARDYYFKAKTNRQGSQVMKTQAEDRLMDIREMEKAKTSDAP